MFITVKCLLKLENCVIFISFMTYLGKSEHYYKAKVTNRLIHILKQELRTG